MDAEVDFKVQAYAFLWGKIHVDQTVGGNSNKLTLDDNSSNIWEENTENDETFDPIGCLQLVRQQISDFSFFISIVKFCHRKKFSSHIHAFYYIHTGDSLNWSDITTPI